VVAKKYLLYARPKVDLRKNNPAEINYLNETIERGLDLLTTAPNFSVPA
jgi:hypothetical protein